MNFEEVLVGSDSKVQALPGLPQLYQELFPCVINCSRSRMLNKKRSIYEEYMWLVLN